LDSKWSRLCFLQASNERKLEAIRETVEVRLKDLQNDNNEKLASTKVAMDVYYIEQTFS
jgi:hypothetical protein